jgi:hypothetical protein
MYLDGLRQVTNSVTSTEVWIAVSYTQKASLASANAVLYFPEGIPHYNTPDVYSGLVMTPQLAQISPNIGSRGGTVINVLAPGLGAAETATLVDSAGNDICQETTKVGYEKF